MANLRRFNYKVDLIFYHRILKCHVIVDLKEERLQYSDVAQMQLYMEYYRQHYMQPDDNPPIGLLLCIEYGQEMVQYLAPFTDTQLFVARYELQLPSKEKIHDFLLRENTSKQKTDTPNIFSKYGKSKETRDNCPL